MLVAVLGKFSHRIKNNITKLCESFPKTFLTLIILTEKSCILVNSEQGMAGWLLLIFFVCLHNQSSSINSIMTVKNRNVWKMRFIKLTVKMNGSSFQQVLWQNLGWFLSQHRKTLFLRNFILKPTATAQLLLKHCTMNFQNSSPFQRLTCFYVTINGNFERFQYFKFEEDFLENKNLFQKTGAPFFSWKRKD